MHMFYKSPGRVLQYLQGINTGPLWKQIVASGQYRLLGPLLQTLDTLLNRVIMKTPIY